MKKLLIRLLLLTLTLFLLTGMGIFVPLAANATGTEGKAMMLGTSSIDGWNETDGYDYIYYGAYDGTPIKWRVLNGQTNIGTDGLFLLSEYALEATPYNSNKPYQYQGSNIKAWCAAFANNKFSQSELAAILATTKSDAASIGDDSYVNYDQVDNILNGDKVFLLSAEENKNAEFGFTSKSARVVYNRENTVVQAWLRSYCSSKSSVGYVNPEGGVSIQAANKDYIYARPALNIDSTRVLFLSAAAGEKNKTFGTIANDTGNEWKATVLDSSRTFAVTETTIKGAPGGYASFHYTGAGVGENEYVSAMLTDENGNILYYGNLEKKHRERYIGNSDSIRTCRGKLYRSHFFRAMQ